MHCPSQILTYSAIFQDLVFKWASLATGTRSTVGRIQGSELLLHPCYFSMLSEREAPGLIQLLMFVKTVSKGFDTTLSDRGPPLS